MNETTYYYCTVCGNVIKKIHDSGVTPMCCMREMEELEAGVTDGKTEWHVPVFVKHSNKVDVSVGKNPHPMEKNHYIEWIELVTNKGVQWKYLSPKDKPAASFFIDTDEKILEVNTYCNLHKFFRCKYEECNRCSS